MINIYNIDGSVLMQVPVTKEAKREEELSESDYISLSFNAAVKVVLPVGAYIEYTYYIDDVRTVTRQFLLLEPYEPTQSSEMSWKYTPEFQHPKMALGKKPFYITTKNSQNEVIKQTNWSFVGVLSTLMGKICDFLNNDLKFGNCGWKAQTTNTLPNAINVSFTDNDVLSALTTIANAVGENCEYHIDYDNEIIYFGKVVIGDTPLNLVVGENIGVPSISESKENYYNAFTVFGGTRNITQTNSKGENISSSDIRLQLEAGNGSIAVDGKNYKYDIDSFSTIDLRQDKQTEPLFTKVLNFSDVFPSLNTYVYNVRGRKKYVLDSTTNQKIPLTYNADGSVATYKTFTVWYMRLAYCTTEKVNDKTPVNTTNDNGTTHYWYDFEVTDDLIIAGKNLSCSFEPNLNANALSTPLAGRGTNGEYVGFELNYHKNSSSSHESDDVSTTKFNILAGDYEIIYQQDNNVIVPTNADEQLIPHGESLPSLKCNITVLYNIAMSDVYKTDAQTRLLNKAKAEIIRLMSDLNNYTFKSYPQVFERKNPHLQIGQNVMYNDGQGYKLNTRILKISTNIDFDFIQEITVGNQAIKGTITQLKEDVQSIIASGNNDSNGYTVTQINDIIAKYGLRYFLSKKNPDKAEGLIRFLKGIALGVGSVDNPLGITADGTATLKKVALYELVSRVFETGAAGSGFRLGNYGNTEDSYLEVDRMLVRKAAEFVQLIIRELRHVGGEIVLTPASIKCTSVEMYSRGDIPWTEGSSEPLDFYRCYFKQEQDGKEIDNQFAVGDLVRCQTFNVKSGTSSNVKNRYYWRRCVYVGKDFIDLSATNADKNSDAPQVGDEMVQLGNDSDKTRQSAILLSSYGDDAPSFKMCQGISAYSLAGKEVFCVSRKELFALADKFQFKTSDGTTQTFAQLLMTLDGFRSEVKRTYATQEEVKQVSSTIEQTAREISLKVTEVTVNMARNCIVGSALREYDEITPINGTEKVTIMSQGVGGTNYAQCYCSGATTNSWTGLYFKDVRVKPQTKYIFSVWMRMTVRPDNGSYVVIKTYNNNVAGTDVVRITFPDSQTLNVWVLHKVALSVPASCNRLLIETSVRKNGAIDLCRPMLEEGETYQGWSLSPYDVTIDDAIVTTGIDIKNGIIKATADTFEVNDNSGNVTARITEDGFFTGSIYATNGYFDGLVRNRKRVITKENFYEYFEKDTNSGMSDAYNPIWEKIGSNFVIQSTPEDADGAAMYLLLVLPTAEPITHPYTDGRYERAREVIGNTIIIRCENGNGITLYGTSRTAPNWDSGDYTGYPYTLKSGYVAYLTCKVKNTGSSSEESGYETIYWERVVRKALP